MSNTQDPRSNNVSQTLDLKGFPEKLEKGLETNETAIRRVTTLMTTLMTKFDATEGLFKALDPSSGSWEARLYEDTRAIICIELRTVLKKSVEASEKGQILCQDALTLCGHGEDHDKTILHEYVDGIRKTAERGWKDASEAAGLFRKIRVQAFQLKRDCSTVPNNTKVLQSLMELLKDLASDVEIGEGITPDKPTVLGEVVDWWQDIEMDLRGIISSLNRIAPATEIRHQSIEHSWEHLSHRYQEYTSRVNKVLDIQEAHRFGVTGQGGNDVGGGGNVHSTHEHGQQRISWADDQQGPNRGAREMPEAPRSPQVWYQRSAGTKRDSQYQEDVPYLEKGQLSETAAQRQHNKNKRQIAWCCVRGFLTCRSGLVKVAKGVPSDYPTGSNLLSTWSSGSCSEIR